MPEGGAASRVKQLRIDIQIGQRIERHYAWAFGVGSIKRSAVANPVGPVTGSRRVARSFRRVFLQSWRATLIGLMPAVSTNTPR